MKIQLLTQPNFSEKFSPGGKGKNLFELQKLNFRVPKFAVVPAESFPAAPDAEFFQALAAEVLQQFDFAENEKFRLAVRSSGVAEDGAQHSFAGQFETCLFVRTENLAEKLEQVWQSGQSERVREYRKNRGLADEQGIAVVVQQMLFPDAAGVAFGVHPVSGDRSQKVVSAVFGVGEGLVSGKLNADTFVIFQNGNIEAEIAEKTTAVVFDKTSGEGLADEDLAEHFWRKPSLSDVQILEIAAALDRLEQHFGCPQDVEFAIAEAQLFLLQTRPVTTLGLGQRTLDKPKIGARPTSKVQNQRSNIVWDNSNIVESYPGLTSPLTFSFILKMYEAVYRQFAAMMGVSDREVEANAETFRNMLGLLRGRVFYNLLSWYKALALLPGYSLNSEFMERMMGVKERFELDNLPERSRFQEKLRVANMVKIMLQNLWALPRMRRDFAREFNSVMAEYGQINFREKDAWTLMQLYQTYEQTLLKRWKAPLVNDFFAMIYFGVLQKLVAKYQLDESGTLHNNLLCGARDIISTDPIRRCLRLATAIQADSDLKKIFLEKTPDELAAMFCNPDREAVRAFPELEVGITEYLEKWGHRCVGELKLETETYRQRPENFLKILQGYVRQGITEQGNSSDIDLKMRLDAEKMVAEKLRGKPFKRLIFKYFLRNARELVSARENLRYERTRGFGTVREIFLALGERLAEAKLIAAPRDIFWLTQEEIFSKIKGTSTTDDLQKLVAQRKLEYQNFENSPPPAERVRTVGIVYFNDLTVDSDAPSSNQPSSIGRPATAALKGLGCCPGIVRARVRIVRDPNELATLGGDILVTTSTDPGWVTLFPTASGILVEKGSLLSHSAIVSREMGKPCVVGITGLLSRLRTGDFVEMDGSSGVVRVLENPTNQNLGTQ